VEFCKAVHFKAGCILFRIALGILNKVGNDGTYADAASFGDGLITRNDRNLKGPVKR
jgi:hypothetical protein